MRILYIFRSLAVWGGIERVLVEKMNHLVTMYGDDVYMLTTDQGDHPVPYSLEPRVNIEDLGILFYTQYRYSGLRRIWEDYKRTKLFEKKLLERIDVIKPDVIVCTTTDPVYSITRVKGSARLIIEAHNICSRALGEKGPHQRIVAWLLKRGLKKSDVLVALTEGDAMEWRRFHSNVTVIPDLVHLNKGAFSSLDNKRVIWVGRYDYQKQPMEILKIWEMVYPHFPNWHLDIYGEGIMRHELEETVKLLDMNIHIHQPTDQIFEAYKNSSVLVSTSLFEPFGLVIPEAMSCGLPVVAYNCPYGPSMIITDKINGYLVDKNQYDSFCDYLCVLMSDISRRKRMGANAVDSVKCFSPDIIMPMWKELFDRISAALSSFSA